MVSRTRRSLATAVAILTAGAFLAGLATPAAAHTDFVGSDPKDGARLGEVPSEVALEFSDDMDPRLSTVTMRVDGGRSTALQVTGGGRPTVLVAEVPDALAAPDTSATRWTVTFRVVSRDGHPVVGTTRFVVRAPSTSPTPEPGDDRVPPSSEPRAGDDAEGQAGEAGPEAADDREAWPLVVLGVGALVLLAGAVGATMRLVGRGADA